VLKTKEKLKDVEVRIIAELMKNSRRSDREIARAIGTSQPTVTRVIRKLEEDGVIREYTMIPDFKRLGYGMMGVVMMGLESPLSKAQFQKIADATSEVEEDGFHPGLMGVNGMSSGRKNRLFVSFYRNYSDYAQEHRLIQRVPYVRPNSIESFLVDLNEETVGVGVLSMSAIADSLLKLLENKEKK
jgi:DNA-binding Lrp family transcriptional regulator